MSRGRKVLLGAVVVMLLLGTGVVWYLGPIAPIATGYAAKTICSGTYLADRSPDDVQGDLPPNPLVPLLRTSVDHAEGSVRTTLLGAWGSTAYVSVYGCTLAEQRPAFAALDSPPEPDLDTSWPAGDGPATLPEDVDADALAAAIATAFTEDDADGRLRNTRAVVVIKDGALIAERYGDGFDADMPLLGWSMAKSVGNAMVGRIIGSGRLALDDAELRDDWADDDRADITLDQLLTMTSGLAFEEVYDPGTDATTMLFTPGSTADYAAGKPLDAAPGTRWSYSSGTTNLLCGVAQDAIGAGPEMAQELVFGPLGMTSAVMEADDGGGLVCSSYLYATARDWARFGQWFLQDGEWDGRQLLPAGWVTYSTTPVQRETENPYGAQWWLNAGPSGELRMPAVPDDAYWASGNEGQHVVVIPSQELVVVRLGFSGGFSGVEWGLEPLLTGIIDATRS
jgi:CubicO group peptidase (beta-lactamase class C family)